MKSFRPVNLIGYVLAIGFATVLAASVLVAVHGWGSAVNVRESIEFQLLDRLDEANATLTRLHRDVLSFESKGREDGEEKVLASFQALHDVLTGIVVDSAALDPDGELNLDNKMIPIADWARIAADQFRLADSWDRHGVAHGYLTTIADAMVGLTRQSRDHVAHNVDDVTVAVFDKLAFFRAAALLLGASGGILMVLTLVQNRDLRRSVAQISKMAERLKTTGTALEHAMTETEVMNEELLARNTELLAAQAKSRHHAERLHAVLEHVHCGISFFDAESRLYLCNDRYRSMYHFRNDPIGMDFRSVRAFLDQAGFELTLNGKVLTGKSEPGREDILVVHGPDGSLYEVYRAAIPAGGWVALHWDATERIRQARSVAYAARHDCLTELPNRAHFNESLHAAFGVAFANETALALVMFDLDRFKQINDIDGHAAGDRILQVIGTRAVEAVGPRGTVARLGGDEFAIVIPDCDGPEGARRLCEALRDQLIQPIDIGGPKRVVGISMGIAYAPRDGRDPATLTRRADIALYAGKASGGNDIVEFDMSLETELIARRALVEDLGEAIRQGGLSLAYQPIVNLETGHIELAEALLRWDHPTLGRIPPDRFIPLAEESGLIGPLGEWVLQHACREAAHWPREIGVAVNLSAAQLLNPGLAASVIQALGMSGLEPSRLELELTESVLFEKAAALELMGRLRELGVSFSLDDFGTGYSSLNYLHQFRFDRLKIDRSFLLGAAGSAEQLVILNAVVELGHMLGIEVVTEGIETEEQTRLARQSGAEFGQGWHFGRPMTAADFRARIHAAQDAAPASAQNVLQLTLEPDANASPRTPAGPARLSA